MAEHEALEVTTMFKFDDRELIYERETVKRFSEYARMLNRHEKAKGQIKRFMAHKKQTQLRLD